MPKPTLATRIHDDPVYRGLIQLVGYLGVAYPISHEAADRLKAQFGEEPVLAAAGELLDVDRAANVARLKPGVRRLCRPLLGPAPEEWDDFYQGVENPPPNPYRRETAAVAEAVAAAVRKETGHDCDVRPDAQDPTKAIIAVSPPPANPARPFAGHPDKRLLDLLDRTQYEMTRCKPGSVSFREALRDIAHIVAELQRRHAVDAEGGTNKQRRSR